MNKIVYAVGGLLVACLASVLLLALMVDPNQFKPLVINQVKEKTNRDITMDGDIRWRFLPSLGLEVEKVHLKNPAHFPKGDTVSIERASVDVGLIPLFSGKIDFRHLLLTGVKVNALRLEDGQHNLAIKLGGQQNHAQKDDKAALDLSENTFEFDILVKSVTFEDGDIEFKDLETKKTSQLSNVSVALGNIVPGQVGNFSLSMDVAQTPYKGHVKIDSRVIPNKTFDVLALPEFRMIWFSENVPVPIDFVNGEFTAHVDLALGSQRFSARDFRLIAGDFSLDGEVFYEGSTIPQINFDVKSPILEADRLLEFVPTQSKPSEHSVAAQSTESQAQDELNLDFLKAVNFAGNVHVERMSFKGANIFDWQMKVTNESGLVQFEKANAKLYEGSVEATGTLDARKKPVQFKVNKIIKDIDLLPLLKEVAQVDSLGGRASLNVNLQGVGLTQDKIRRTVYGDVSMNIKEGYFVGVDLAKLARVAASTLSNQQSDREDEKTEFTEAFATFQVEKGAARTRDLNLVSPLLNAQGWGRTNLIDESLDFMLDLTLSDELLTGPAERLQGKKLPMRITGNWSHPRYMLDVESLLKSKVEQFRDEIAEKVKSTVDEKLRSLFD